MGPILGALISFIQVPLLTYFLTEAEYGRASLFNTLIVTIPFYIFFGLDQAYTREYQAAKDKVRLLQIASFFPFLVGLVLFLITLPFSQALSNWLFESPEFGHIVIIGGVWVLATVFERFFLLAIRMEEKAFTFSMYNLVLKVMVFVVSMLLILLGMRDFRVIVYGLLVGQLLGDLVLFYNYRHYFDFSGFSVDWPLLKRMFQFGIPVMVAVTLSNSLSAIDNLFLRQYRDYGELGIYSVALRIMAVIGIVRTAFTSFWIPTAYRWHEEGKEIKYFKYISDVVLFGLSLMFYGMLIFKGIVILIVNDSYSDVQYLLGLMAFPHIMYTLSETTNLGIVFSRKTHFNILVSIAALVPSLVLNYLLTPRFGYIGAATASFASYIMFYFSRTYFSNRLGFSFPQKKQTLSIVLMSVAAFLNAFSVPYIEVWTLLLGLMTLGVQISTIKQSLEIKQNSQEWNFD